MYYVNKHNEEDTYDVLLKCFSDASQLLPQSKQCEDGRRHARRNDKWFQQSGSQAQNSPQVQHHDPYKRVQTFQTRHLPIPGTFSDKVFFKSKTKSKSFHEVTKFIRLNSRVKSLYLWNLGRFSIFLKNYLLAHQNWARLEPCSISLNQWRAFWWCEKNPSNSDVADEGVSGVTEAYSRE